MFISRAVTVDYIDSNCFSQRKISKDKWAVKIDEQLKASGNARLEALELIGLAAAFHPDVLQGNALVLADISGQPLATFDPQLSARWVAFASLSLPRRDNAIVIRCGQENYYVEIDGRLLEVEGDNALFRALQAIRQQCDPECVNPKDILALRSGLYQRLESVSDQISVLWQQRREQGMGIQLPELKEERCVFQQQWQAQSAQLIWQAHQLREQLNNRGTFNFTPRLKPKGALMLAASMLNVVNPDSTDDIACRYPGPSALPVRYPHAETARPKAESAESGTEQLTTTWWDGINTIGQWIDKALNSAFSQLMPWNNVSGGAQPLNLTEEESRIFHQYALHSLNNLQHIYHPVLNPRDYFENYITEGISRYEQANGISTGLRSNSTIQVTCSPIVSQNMNLQGPKAPLPVQLNYSVVDIVTGQYKREINQQRDALGRSYRVDSMTHQALIEALTEENLERRMKADLDAWRNNPEFTSGLKKFYRQMVVLRCLSFLDRYRQASPYRTALLAFLDGKLEARELLFHENLLNGVFLIPVGDGGLLMSVDEPKFFYLRTRERQYWQGGLKKTEKIMSYPRTEEFKRWVLSKIPVYYAMKYANDRQAFVIRTAVRSRLLFSGLEMGKVLLHPFRSRPGGNQYDLADNLLAGLMQRLESDIDTLVLTRREELSLQALNLMKLILMIYSPLLMIALPGTGSLLTRISHFAVSVGLDAAYIGIIAIQAHIVDRPDQSEAFVEEAISATILSGISGTIGGTSLARQGANRITTLLKRYRQVRLWSRQTLSTVREQVRCHNLSEINKLGVLSDMLHEEPVAASKIGQSEKQAIVKQTGDLEENPLPELNRNLNRPRTHGGNALNPERTVSESKLGRVAYNQRQARARVQLMFLEQNHPELRDRVETFETASFSLTTVRDDPADKLVLLSHGFFTRESPLLRIPADKTLSFLGPHGKILFETEEVDGLLPTERLLSVGKQTPTFYASLVNKEIIVEKRDVARDVATWHLDSAGTDKPGYSINYSISHYERTPREEITAAVWGNRINSKEKIDVLTVKPEAEQLKTLKDVIDQMRRGGDYARYKQIVFSACREEKQPLTLKRVNKHGLGDGYQIEFKNKVKKRSAKVAQQELHFDGYTIFSQITLRRDSSDTFIPVDEKITEVLPFNLQYSQ